ncbi:hypothetical protein [Mamestra configurata nucleopolyhedrovirus B]|uniref:Maco-B 59 n=1 Tax=Mamestra configurata nucleopolyhedrovirus B TaxID=204440 RepID=Q8JM93_9ABAC|nr:hypothetical protein McnBVgp059 [Mamestra configurata nucleopolyhedrovirus B]AAM95046.1 hypothetical protein [Mamestra configurata nucleopolyhedrovirus B]QNH90702.1 maco-B 59 [Mamestra configurata nucleopolyhedrovirus B]
MSVQFGLDKLYQESVLLPLLLQLFLPLLQLFLLLLQSFLLLQLFLPLLQLFLPLLLQLFLLQQVNLIDYYFCTIKLHNK